MQHMHWESLTEMLHTACLCFGVLNDKQHDTVTDADACLIVLPDTADLHREEFNHSSWKQAGW